MQGGASGRALAAALASLRVASVFFGAFGCFTKLSRMYVGLGR